jgi:hypothetical protein
MDNEMKNLADTVYNFTGKLVEEGNTPFAVAAVYTMIALQIYKTSLSEEEYHSMVNAISLSRDKVQPLNIVSDRTLN